MKSVDRTQNALRAGQLWTLVGVFSAYFLGSLAGFVLNLPLPAHRGNIGILWPPNGVLLAFLLNLPPRGWWRVLLAALPAHLLAQWMHGTPIWLMGVQYTNNCILLLVAAGAYRKFTRHQKAEFSGLRQITVYVVVVVLMTPALVAALAAAIRVITGISPSFLFAWRAIALSTALTIAVLTPGLTLFLSWLIRGRYARDRWPLRRQVEFILMASGLLVVGSVAFLMPLAVGPVEIPARVFLPLSFVLWSALRFGPGGTSFSLSIVTVLCARSVMTGRGTFAGGVPAEGVLAIQLFLLIASLPMLFLAAILRERQETLTALRDSEAEARRHFSHLEAVYRSAPVGLAFVDKNLVFRHVNDVLARQNGLPAAEHVGRSVKDVLPGALAERAELLCQHVLETGVADIDREADGRPGASPDQTRHWLVSHHPVRDEKGVIFGVSVIITDITEQKRAQAELTHHQTALHLSLDRIQDLAGRLITVQEAERSRIARDLHDDVSQQLASLSMALSAIRRRMPPGDAARKELAAIQKQTGQLVDEVRNLSHDLHSGVLRHAGLVPAMRAYCDEVNRKHGIETLFAADEGIVNVPPNVSLCLYRVLQESMANVLRHAGASQTTVKLSSKNDGLYLSVTDNGRGFEVAAADTSHGLRLISIDERIRLVQGRMSIESQPNKGTSLSVWVPRRDG